MSIFIHLYTQKRILYFVCAHICKHIYVVACPRPKTVLFYQDSFQSYLKAHHALYFHRVTANFKQQHQETRVKIIGTS